MRRYLHIIGFGIILLIAINTISFSCQNKEFEYGNHPAECIGTFVHINSKQSRDKYYILIDAENKADTMILKMNLEDVIIQNIEKKAIILSDIHTGDTIKVFFMGDVILGIPAEITKIQSVTLLNKNHDVDAESLIKLVPEH